MCQETPDKPLNTSLSQNSSSGNACLESTEDSIIQFALSGDERAYEHLYHRYRHQVLHICLQYSVGDQDQAKDLCQETFISAFLNLGRLRDRSRFTFWITEIARNKCVSFIRKQCTADKILRDYEAIKPTMTGNILQWSEEELELIAELIRSVENPDLRETIRLFYIEGKKTGEIGRLQKISQTAVTTRLNRFRTKFRKHVTQEILKRRITDYLGSAGPYSEMLARSTP